jgi:DnaK suppressor protein
VALAALRRFLLPHFAKPMTEDERDRLHAKLIELRASLREQIDVPDSTAASITPDNAIGRLTRMEALQAQQMNEAGRRRDEARLRQVDKALGMFSDGSYGTCIRCGEAIPAGRLEIRPESRLCVRCAAHT